MTELEPTTPATTPAPTESGNESKNEAEAIADKSLEMLKKMEVISATEDDDHEINSLPTKSKSISKTISSSSELKRNETTSSIVESEDTPEKDVFDDSTIEENGSAFAGKKKPTDKKFNGDDSAADVPLVHSMEHSVGDNSIAVSVHRMIGSGAKSVKNTMEKLDVNKMIARFSTCGDNMACSEADITSFYEAKQANQDERALTCGDVSDTVDDALREILVDADGGWTGPASDPEEARIQGDYDVQVDFGVVTLRMSRTQPKGRMVRDSSKVEEKVDDVEEPADTKNEVLDTESLDKTADETDQEDESKLDEEEEQEADKLDKEGPEGQENAEELNKEGPEADELNKQDPDEMGQSNKEGSEETEKPNNEAEQEAEKPNKEEQGVDKPKKLKRKNKIISKLFGFIQRRKKRNEKKLPKGENTNNINTNKILPQ